MMTAYPECYLDTAKTHLAEAFDYAVRDWGIDGNVFSNMLAFSQVGREFSHGSPWAVCGLSGVELAQTVMGEKLPKGFDCPEPTMGEGRSVPYWVGWSVAYYQWVTSCDFASVFALAPYEELECMYSMYHEQDISAFVRDMKSRHDDIATARPTKLKLARERVGLSQSQLAKAAGVGLRSVQMYEQRNNDIDKAQGAALFRMAKVLGCMIEDLLEDPLGGQFEYEYVKL